LIIIASTYYLLHRSRPRESTPKFPEYLIYPLIITTNYYYSSHGAPHTRKRHRLEMALKTSNVVGNPPVVTLRRIS
jgi:hypothetical protein